jgi:hypothetical protein
VQDLAAQGLGAGQTDVQGDQPQPGQQSRSGPGCGQSCGVAPEVKGGEPAESAAFPGADGVLDPGVHPGLGSPAPGSDLVQSAPYGWRRGHSPEQLALVGYNPKSPSTSAPSATARLRSATTRRCSGQQPLEGSAFDRPAVSPVPSDSTPQQRYPRGRHDPVPPAVTSSPFGQSVFFIRQLLLELGAMRISATPVVPVQKHLR